MSEETPEDARTITPFKIIHRGEDTVDSDDVVRFADFSPKVLPSDAPEEEGIAPKGESAPARASSLASRKKTEPTKSEKNAPENAGEAGGKSSRSESGSQTSSSPKKSG